MVGCFTLLAPMGSSIIAPAIPGINNEFGVTNTVEGEMTISLFVLAFALGPLFIAPLSEVYGRRWVILVPGVFFLVFNIACGFSQNMPELLAFRFLASLGGSAPLAIGAGIISDIFPPGPDRVRDERLLARAVAWPGAGTHHRLLYSAITPIGGGSSTSSPSLTAPSSSSDTSCSKKPTRQALLSQKAANLGKPGHYVGAPGSVSLSRKLSESVKRPFILLLTQPIVQVVSLYMAYVYGLMYLVLATFTKLWLTRYNESVSTSGLNYLALGLGLLVGSIGVSPLADKIYFSQKEKNNGVAVPEFRLPFAIPVAVLLPAALFAYGWSAQQQAHWLAPDAAIAVFAFCFAVPFQIIQIYLVDSYRRYAASAMAAATFLRSCAGFAFPLFAGSMYDRLDYGWGNSVLAFVAVVGIPAPLLVYKFGAYLRAKSTYAAG
ncbi:major facilitator superfamily domain-containing protein [Zopfochytrium polystomum]|nr:major facilitator superfamily domain-containing protein [Zopfochytrium polystomum]